MQKIDETLILEPKDLLNENVDMDDLSVYDFRIEQRTINRERNIIFIGNGIVRIFKRIHTLASTRNEVKDIFSNQ